MNRKSVRTFSGEKLSDGQIETLLRAAMAAPTEGNVQPWSFIVLSDPGKVAEVFGDDHHADIYMKAGAVIIVCGDTTVTRPPKGKPDAAPETLPSQFWFEDCGAATENLLLAAEATGLGAVWMSSYPVKRKMQPLVERLGIPDGVLPFAIVPVGYPAGDEQPKDKWNPEKVHYNLW